MNELKRRERWAELAASIAAADRAKQLQTRRHWRIGFWFSPYQVALEPVVAEPAPEAPAFASGVGSGGAGSETPLSHTSTGFVGPAGPQRRCPPCDGTGPATPHPLEAVRLSGTHTWT